MEFLAETPQPPYYAVVFSTLRSAEEGDGYGEMAERMEELAREQPGFLGVESVRGADGCGITVSYWASLEAIGRWGAHVEHRLAQAQGRARWYRAYRLRVCRVEAERRHERGV
jgi:heme-degrading monooxygenase HmoA